MKQRRSALSALPSLCFPRPIFRGSRRQYITYRIEWNTVQCRRHTLESICEGNGPNSIQMNRVSFTKHNINATCIKNDLSGLKCIYIDVLIVADKCQKWTL